jgi:hypothetical protein
MRLRIAERPGPYCAGASMISDGLPRYAVARALRARPGRATVPAGTSPLSSTVNTPVNNGVTPGPFVAPPSYRSVYFTSQR